MYVSVCMQKQDWDLHKLVCVPSVVRVKMVKDGRQIELRLYNDGTKPDRQVRLSAKRSDGDESFFVFDSMAHAYMYLKRTHQRAALDYVLHQALYNNPNLQHEQF